MTRRPVNRELLVPARYYARAAELLAAREVAVADWLAAVGLQLADLQRPEAQLPLSSVDRLIQQGLALSGRDDLGFELGRALKLSSHSIVGFGILSSPSVDYALRLASRYFPLIMPSFRMRYRQWPQQREILFEAVAEMSPACLRVHLEAIAVATHFELRELLQGRMPDYRLELGMASPAHLARYAELAEARLRFDPDGPAVRLCLPASIGDRAPAMADPSALQLAEARCDAQVREAVAGGQLAVWTRRLLQAASDGPPSRRELARSLNMSARTLDRHLQREGTSFRALLQDSRQARACELLARGHQPITSIALELGYSDAANFTRWFRRRFGETPSAFRQREGEASRPSVSQADGASPRP